MLHDRGIPDVLAYLRLCGLPVPAHVDAAARRHRYAATVLFAPPWAEIYSQDTERKQSLSEAARTFETLLNVYGELGYEPIMLPKTSVAARTAFVRAALGM